MALALSAVWRSRKDADACMERNLKRLHPEGHVEPHLNQGGVSDRLVRGLPESYLDVVF
jgi:hypothetical protein